MSAKKNKDNAEITPMPVETNLDPEIPDYLLSALQQEAEEGNNDVFVEPVYDRVQVNLRRVIIPQRNSTRYDGLAGKIIIEPYRDQKDENGNPMEIEVVSHLDFILVDALTIDAVGRGADRKLVNGDGLEWVLSEASKHKASFPLGGRLMWKFMDSGERDREAKEPVCASANGIEPRPSFIGKDVRDYRTGETVKIGYQRDSVTGKYFKSQHGCLGCPFSRWLQEGETIAGKKRDASCRPSFTYVIWDVDRKELMLISGVNTGNQMALNGTTYAKSGHRYDDVPFQGIKYNFAYTGKSDDGTPLFRNRPNGKPTLANPNVPTYAVRMSVTTNNFSPATIVPTFTLLDGSTPFVPAYNANAAKTDSAKIDANSRMLTSEEYAAYLAAASGVYSKNNYRSVLMGLGYLTHDTEYIPAVFEPQLLSSGENTTDSSADSGAGNFDNPF